MNSTPTLSQANSASTNQPIADPSIAELGEQLDAFVAQIQNRLQAIADADLQLPPVDQNQQRNAGPLDRLSAIKQRLAERMESCNES